MSSPVEQYNRTELAEIVRRRTQKVVRHSLPIERLRHLAVTGEMPSDTEISGSMQTRISLERFILSKWVEINSQLPCSGELRGRCTVYPCSEGRHAACFMQVPPHMMV